MAKKKKIDILSEKAIFYINKLHETHGEQNTFVGLNRFARDVGIKRIKVLPLLSDGGVFDLDEGYEIWINTEAPGSFHDLNTNIELDSDEWKKFTPPIRFTIAHEIAHVIFFNLDKEKYSRQYYKKYSDEIEEACSKLATKILINKNFIFENFSNKIFDTRLISETIKTLKVSPEVFINRLNHEDIFRIYRNYDGMTTLLSKKENDLKILQCVIFGPNSNQRFRVGAYEGTIFDLPGKKSFEDKKSPIGLSITELLKLPELTNQIKSNNFYKEKFRLPCGKEFLPCEMESFQHSKNPFSIIATFKISGPLEK